MFPRLAATFLALGLAAVPAAQAASVSITGYAYGSAPMVHATAPAYNGQAGGFATLLDGMAIQSYCLEIPQSYFWNVVYTDFTQLSGLAYFGAADGKAYKLGRLLSYVQDSAGAVDTAAESASMQLAVWNIVYDTDLSLAGGAFGDTSAYAAYGETLLAQSAHWVNSMNVWVLASPTRQDQLIWSRTGPGPNLSTGNPVPAPASLPLALLALGLMGAAGRYSGRRSSSAAPMPSRQNSVRL